MALAGKAVMINWSDVDPEFRSRYYEWHRAEHQIKRMSIPGFNCFRRYIAVRAERVLLNMYEVDDLGTLTGPEYKAQVGAPSPLTKTVGMWVKNAIRGLCHVRHSVGDARGGFVLTLRFDVKEGKAEQLTRAIIDGVLPRLMTFAEIASAHFFVADDEASSYVSPERRDRPSPTTPPKWILMIEGVSAESLDRAIADQSVESELDKAGARGPIINDLYQLHLMVMKGWPQ